MNTKHNILWLDLFKQLVRTMYVLYILLSFLLYVYLDKINYLYFWKRTTNENKLRLQAIKLRRCLTKLGPTFIKLGQALGTRADLLPISYVDELSKLHNQVPPFPTEQAIKIIEQELGNKIQTIFARFTSIPIAAASLGQVYRARLHNGAEVVVKVQRPNLEKQLKLDLNILRYFGRFLIRYPKFFKGTDWLGTIDEFDQVIHKEINYLLEGQNAEQFKKNFNNWPNIYVPTIFWEFSTPRVLTMEYIKGIKITDLEKLSIAGINIRTINETMNCAYFKQLLEDGFFHADPHPGNILILADGKLVFLDFGMVGLITNELQTKMVTAFFHILDRDYDGIVNDLISLGFLSAEVNFEEFRAIVIDMFKRKIDLKLSQVRFKELTYELAEIIYKYPFVTPATFTFVMRALMTLEGISIQTNPDFHFLEVAKPYARDFLIRNRGSHLSKIVWESLHDSKSGNLDWQRLLKLASNVIGSYLN